MKRTIIALALAVAACEGEPPKVPTGQVAPVGVPPEEGPTTETPATPPGAACPCACNCTGGVTPAAGDAGAAEVITAADAAVAPAAAKGTVTGAVTTTPKGQAANAVVYLEDAPIEPAAKMSATLDNHMMTFTPFVAVVPVGGRIVFHNSDPFPHNVYSPDNEKFDIGALPQNQARARTFKSPGAYTVLCNLHPGMIGYILATPSSYFAKADGKGHYKLKDVPNGTYKITAWAPRQQPVTQSVTVKSGDVVQDFELHR